jgi:N-acetylmuramoyl-L-alanine amidase
MSGEVNKTRRRIIQLGLASSISLVLNKLYADSTTQNKINNDTSMQLNQNHLIAIRVWPSDIYTRVILETSHKLQVKYFFLTSPDRLAIDITNVHLNDLLKKLNTQVMTNDPVIKGIKVGQFNPTTVRIVLYLKQNIKVQSQSLDPIKFSSIEYSYRYLLDIYPASAISKQEDLSDDLLAMLKLSSESSQDKKRDNYPSFKVPSTTKAKAKIIVMLDPGHGGEDPGAIGMFKTKEKYVVLSIAKKLYDMINQTDYMHAEMTRTHDIFIPLGTRVAIARKTHADLFVSIHADAFTSPEPSGSSVFTLSDKGASSSFARWLASTQNASDQIGGASFKTQSTSVRKVLLDMSQTWTRRQSNHFGDIMLNNIAKVHKLHNKAIEQANFAVLKAPDIPSVLVETAFISNPRDEVKLQSQEFQQEIANALFQGVSSYAKTILK